VGGLGALWSDRCHEYLQVLSYKLRHHRDLGDKMAVSSGMSVSMPAYPNGE
jgi:hypothetical protein